MVLGVLERDHGAGPARQGDGRRQQPVVGPEQDPARDLDAQEPPVGAHAGVDDRHDDRVVGEVLHRPHEEERTRTHVVRRDVVPEVDDPHVGREAEHDGLAHADELVGVAVVRGEGDDHRVRLRASAQNGRNDEPARAERMSKRGPMCPRRSAGLCVPRPQVRVDVDIAHPE